MSVIEYLKNTVKKVYGDFSSDKLHSTYNNKLAELSGANDYLGSDKLHSTYNYELAKLSGINSDVYSKVICDRRPIGEVSDAPGESDSDLELILA